MIFQTRYQAKKHAASGDVVVKVDGVYTVMTAREYQIWRWQK
jgi:hypothetical protein